MSNEAREGYALSLQTVWDRIKQWSYEEKIDHARMVVKEAVDTHGKTLAVACSFGKDSLVCLHMVRKLASDVFVSFQNTLCQEIGIYRLKKRLTKEWNLNVIESRPGNFKNGIKVTFWSCVKLWDFPGFKARRGDKVTYPKCCYYLKEKPARLLYKKHGVDGVVFGIQAVESNNRIHTIKKSGCMYYVKSEKLWKYQPIAFWTVAEVWRYIRDNNIPYPEEYDIKGVDRLGCKFCTAYKTWEFKMNLLHPKIYKKIKRMMGVVFINDVF